MSTALVLVWILITMQVLTIAACATLLARSHRRDASRLARTLHRTAPALLASGVLPVPALLAADAPAVAWGLWGAGTIAAALVHAAGDTLRDIPSPQAVTRAGSGS
ncbi:hypothetical protein OG616_38470 [Streptomyces antibioticus]|uniref:hypothetical protein n=1 Tax=Streptomyces antibioticus TaxID=1890 RepID=UPI00225B2682|nr:hypothetical protein [Streptomyces antibioticus]MCX5173874.1 hypothetical protein [Streptomyces antibioticus]